MRAELPGILAFLEAALTVELAGLGGVMLHGNEYAWPPAAALAFISLGAVLAGIRRVQALYGAPPR